MLKKHFLAFLLIIFIFECIFLFFLLILNNEEKRRFSVKDSLKVPSPKQAHFPSLYVDKKPFEKKLQVSLTLEKIFSSNHQVQEFPQFELRTIVVTGDVLLARSVNYQMYQRKDFDYPFEKTGDFLKSADLTFINLENPLIDNCPLINAGMVFCGNPIAVEGLVFAGVDIASLTNNHAGDWGDSGLESTIEILEKNNIDVIGQDEILIKEVSGLKFAFLGYDLVKTALDETKILNQLKEAKSQADIVIVYFHWGIEYTNQPTQNQRNLARLAIDSGADLVIGSHPHWIQGVEIYKDKLIVYSHGNFIFDQIWSEETKKGIAGKYVFYKDQLVDVEFLPIFMEEFAQPQFLAGEQKKEILDLMKQKSID